MGLSPQSTASGLTQQSRMTDRNGMSIQVLNGDCREILPTLPAGSVQCCVTSPPYFGLRDYGVAGQIGLETTPNEFIAAMVEVFREVRRVLADDGTLWLNLGDSYAMSTKGAGGQGKQHTNAGSVHADRSWRIPTGFKPKDLLMIPARVALALQADGWWLRSHIIWHKPNPMPESVTDRPTSSHESIFLLTKSARYFYDAEAVKENSTEFERTPNRARVDTGIRKGKTDARIDAVNQCGVNELRNLRNVWTVATQPFSGAHFATFPPALIEPCIKAGSRPGDTVLDPFGGAGTTGLVADRLNRNAILIELNPTYAAMAGDRIQSDAPLFAEVFA